MFWIAEQDERHQVETALGPFVYKRKAGTVLDPTRESIQAVQKIKLIMGSYNFASQYQQNPAPLGGAMVKTEWLHYYDPEGPLPDFVYTLQSWDTANKSGDLNDYSVCTTWGYYDRRYYLLHVLRARLNFPQLKAMVADQAERYEPRAIVIEDKAFGTQLIQELKSHGEYRVKPYPHRPAPTKRCVCTPKR